MATIHTASTAILMSDTPVSYTSPRGPAVPFRPRYNSKTQRLLQKSEFGWLTKQTYPDGTFDTYIYNRSSTKNSLC